MDVWRRSSPGTDPRRESDEGHRSAALQSHHEIPRLGLPACGGVFLLSSGVKWLDVGTSGFSAIAAVTHNGVSGNGDVPGSRGT
jgi:hypothetical protein